MKTPMQEMIEVIKEKLKVDTLQYNARPSNGSLMAIRMSQFYLEAAESMLEKEKDVIIDAYFEGARGWFEECRGDVADYDKEEAEKYYKDTFTK